MTIKMYLCDDTYELEIKIEPNHLISIDLTKEQYEELVKATANPIICGEGCN